jgi:hypothetical protein
MHDDDVENDDDDDDGGDDDYGISYCLSTHLHKVNWFSYFNSCVLSIPAESQMYIRVSF